MLSGIVSLWASTIHILLNRSLLMCLRVQLEAHGELFLLFSFPNLWGVSLGMALKFTFGRIVGRGINPFASYFPTFIVCPEDTLCDVASVLLTLLVLCPFLCVSLVLWQIGRLWRYWPRFWFLHPAGGFVCSCFFHLFMYSLPRYRLVLHALEG